MRRRLTLVATVVGVLAMGALALGSVTQPRHAMFSYLTAYTYVLSLALGSLAMLFIGHVTGARWFVVMRRGPEMMTGAFPLLGLLFLPVLMQLEVLYPWVLPWEALEPHVAQAIAKKQSYLSVPVFVARSVLYLAFWIVSAELLRRWSRRQDRDDDGALARRQRAFSAAMLPLFAFTLTFASFDWLMSLTPAWYSNALGFYVFTGSFLGAIALVIVVAERARSLLRLPAESERSLFHVLGKLLLVAVILWAYIAFSQFFLLWIADIPEEISWYLPRISGEWGVFAVVVVVAHFALPFLALLSKPLKRRPRALTFVAAWLLGAHFLDLYWLVIPTLHPAGVFFDWTTPLALLGVGGLTVAFVTWRARGLDVVPRHDPLLAAGWEYRTR